MQEYWTFLSTHSQSNIIISELNYLQHPLVSMYNSCWNQCNVNSWICGDRPKAWSALIKLKMLLLSIGYDVCMIQESNVKHFVTFLLCCFAHGAMAKLWGGKSLCIGLKLHIHGLICNIWITTRTIILIDTRVLSEWTDASSNV